MSNTLAQVLEQLSSDHQFTVIGDTDHRNLALRDKLAEKENFASLARSGVKHLFLEFPAQLNPLAQQLAQGEISRSDFVGELEDKFRPNFLITPEAQQHMRENTATLIETAKQHGITTHFVDPGNGVTALNRDFEERGNYLIKAMLDDKQKDNPADYKEIKGLLTDTFNTTAKGEQRIVALMTDWVQQLPPARLKEVTEGLPKLHDDSMEKRLDDRALADNIKAVAGNEKAAIFYGNEHGSYQGGLTDLLGSEKCSRILLLGARRELEDVIEPKIDRELEHRTLKGFYALEEGIYEPISLGGLEKTNLSQLSLPTEKTPTHKPPGLQ